MSKIIDISEDIDVTEDIKEHKKPSTLKTLLCIGIPLLIFMIIGIIGLQVFKYIRHKNSIMPKSHVYVCDNPKVFSDFDNWLRDDLGITWTPTYMIVKDGYIIGAFEGAIPKDNFTDQLATCVAYNLQLESLPDYEISNLEGERNKISDVLGGTGTYILEIHWTDCEDCQFQDENYTQEIYETYTTERIFRYYIKSDKSDVEAKY